MSIGSSHADLKTWLRSGVRRLLASWTALVLMVALSVAITAPNGWCTAKQEPAWGDDELRQEGVWEDHRKPFEEDILVSRVATIRVNLPKRFFTVEKITLSITTDATLHSEPKIAVGQWEKSLGEFLTPQEYFTTLLLTETINLEIPTKFFRRGENEIRFYSLTDSPEDQYIVTKLEFAVSREKIETIPRPEAPEKVRIGVLTNIAGGSVRTDEEKYVHLLTDEIRKKPDREVVTIKEAISYHNLDINTARNLGQAYRVDMVIGIESIYRTSIGIQGATKLVDISGQRLVELEAVSIGSGYASFRPGWEKKLVSQQIGPIEKMIDEISREKMLAGKSEERWEVILPEPTEPRKVRIGVLTELQKNLETEYFDHLKETLEKREDNQLLLLVGPFTYDRPHPEAIEGLKQKHQIDMIIYIGSKASSTGEVYWTGLVNTSNQEFVEVPTVYVKQENRYRWEKILVERQIKPIEEMIDEISREK